jgi:hypothetical protein
MPKSRECVCNTSALNSRAEEGLGHLIAPVGGETSRDGGTIETLGRVLRNGAFVNELGVELMASPLSVTALMRRDPSSPILSGSKHARP